MRRVLGPAFLLALACPFLLLLGGCPRAWYVPPPAPRTYVEAPIAQTAPAVMQRPPADHVCWNETRWELQYSPGPEELLMPAPNADVQMVCRRPLFDGNPPTDCHAVDDPALAEWRATHRTWAAVETVRRCGTNAEALEASQEAERQAVERHAGGVVVEPITEPVAPAYPTINPRGSARGAPYPSGGGRVHVRGYYRRDGTYVRPHTRRR